MSGALDRFLPRYQFSERHRIRVKGAPEAVFAAVEAMDLTDSRIARGLMAVWRIPARWVLKEVPDRPMSVRDFIALERTPPTDLVRGMIGGAVDRGVARTMTPDGFVAFAAPGCFKLAWGFHVRPVEGAWLVETETRVHCTDARALRWFRAYWLVIRLPSGLIRRRLLAAIKRRLESPQARSGQAESA